MKLKTIRVQLGLSVRQMANLAKIPPATYQRVEEAEEIPDKFKLSLSRVIGDRVVGLN